MTVVLTRRASRPTFRTSLRIDRVRGNWVLQDKNSSSAYATDLRKPQNCSMSGKKHMLCARRSALSSEAEAALNANPVCAAFL
jgi:hypothetical protein